MKNSYQFRSTKISFDFALGNIKGLKNVFSTNDGITVILCLFHLSQAWWRKANKIGLRKKKYVKEAKCVIFNLQLLNFMDYDTAKDFYSLIKNEYSEEKYSIFFNYFEATWFPLNNDDEVKYDFSLWSYFGKFNFKGNKK